MTMTFDIPSDVQNDVAGIPGLDLRVALYLQHEAKLDVLRRQRHMRRPGRSQNAPSFRRSGIRRQASRGILPPTP